MKIIQELYSTNGFLRLREIQIQDVVKAKNVVLPFSKFTTNIVTDNNSLIICRNEKIRNTIINAINADFIAEKDVSYLSLDSFYEDLLPVNGLEKLVGSYRFYRHLAICTQHIINKHKFINKKNLQNTDAFRNFPLRKINKIVAKQSQIFSDYELEVFSRTLATPREFHDIMCPSTFWQLLYGLSTPNSTTITIE